MGKKSTPVPPDYAAAAQIQAQSSKDNTEAQTIANRPDLYTPWGSQTWTQDTNNPNQWSSTISLSEDQQKALDDQMAIQAGRSQGALQLLDQATGSFQTPIDYSSLPKGATSVDAPQLGSNAPAFGFGGGGPITTSLGPQGDLIKSLGPRAQLPGAMDLGLKDIAAPSVGVQSASSGPLKYQMDHTAGEWRQKGQDAALQFIQGGIDRRRAQLETQLANMGLARGSEAWNTEMERDNDMATRDRLQAFGAGQSEANMLFGQDLQSGQFTNAARAQEFSQNAFNAQQANAAALASAQMGLQAQIANNNTRLQAGDFQLRSAGQGFNQDLAAAQFGNQAELQDFNRDLVAGQFGNQAQQQGFNQDLSRLQTYNQAVQQQDQRLNNQFLQQIQAGGYNQNIRNAALNEAISRRSQPLNELNALLTGQQVQNPNMPSFAQSGRAQDLQALDAANMGYQGQLDATNSARGMFGQLAGAGIMGAAMMFSDARLKEDIKYTGDSIGGVPVVHYRYRGLPGLRVGVIAQDVLRIKPQAVILDPSGYFAVNYSELCA